MNFRIFKSIKLYVKYRNTEHVTNDERCPSCRNDMRKKKNLKLKKKIAVNFNIRIE